MKVALISGLWPTKDANGLDDLAFKIEALSSSLECVVRRYDDKSLFEADILIGHSLGGEACVNFASKSAHIRYMALIDPVCGAWFPFFFWVPGQHFHIPSSVEKADCFKRRSGIIPPSSKILNERWGTYDNYLIEMSHADAPRNEDVQAKILKQIASLASLQAPQGAQ